METLKRAEVRISTLRISKCYGVRHADLLKVCNIHKKEILAAGGDNEYEIEYSDHGPSTKLEKAYLLTRDQVQVYIDNADY